MLVVVEKLYFGAKADASLAAVTADAAASDALVVAVSLWPDAVEADEALLVADAADSAAFVLLVDALEALAVALELAAEALLVALAASTISDHLAESVFVVSG